MQNWGISVRLLRAAALIVILSAATPVFARLEVHPAAVDIQRDLLPSAEVIFRGRVVTVGSDPWDQSKFIATFDADRWYKDKLFTPPILSFAYHGREMMGHDCIMFSPGTYWIVFAKRTPQGALELVHDCHGALAISGRLGPQLSSPDPLVQLEADFEAGLDDADPAARLLSIQRLGNLKFPAAHPALHRVLVSATGEDRVWIVLAALRTGDTTVLPEAAALLRNWRLARGGEPQGMIALELREVKDQGAAPQLIEILHDSHEQLVVSCLLQVLGDRLRDPRALPVIASFLGNAERGVNYNALVGVWNLTHAPACSLEHWKEEAIPAITQACKSWWETAGKNQAWPDH